MLIAKMIRLYLCAQEYIFKEEEAINLRASKGKGCKGAWEGVNYLLCYDFKKQKDYYLKNFPTKEYSEADILITEFYQKFMDEILPILFKLSHII